MKQSLHLTIEKDLYNLLKIKRLNVSRYVEKLVYLDLISKQKKRESVVGSSNLLGPTFILFLQIRLFN